MPTPENGRASGATEAQNNNQRRQYNPSTAIRKRPTAAELEAALTEALEKAQRRPWPPHTPELRLQRDHGLISWVLPARRSA